MSVAATSRVRPGFVLGVVCALALVGGGAPLRSQRATLPPDEPGQGRQFRAGTDTVPVYVTVRDPRAGFVTDLGQDDFEVRDDGRVQTITQFTTDVQPLSVLVLIDGSGSMLPEFDRSLEGARSFVLRMLPADRARIGGFADRVAFSPRFTSDRDELLAWLDDEFNLRVGDETHLWEAIVDGTRVLADETGRRVILALSDGYNFVLPPGAGRSLLPPGGPGSGPPPIGRGPGGNPIGLGGRNPTGGTASPPVPIGSGGVAIGDPSRNGVPLDSARDAATETDAIVFAVSMWVRDGTSSTRPSRDLEQLAVETGGAFYRVRDQDDMSAPFTEILQQLHQQYVLGFTPREFDGRRHKLDVRVKRRGVEVLARRSYVATRERAPR